MTGTLDTERGRVLADRYELTALIGAGGAARVYRATDRQLGREVAVKLLDDTAARSADPAARQRFVLEARTAAAVAHPNIVAVYDAGVDGNALFLVMEHVDGSTLAERLAAHGALPIDAATSVARQLAAGLAAAHARGVLHRDVKPANVLLDRSGRALLADFGIAKRLDEIESALTTDGMVVGTPAYLAPEQATAGVLTPATDVYALGVVLNEMLTGWRPRGESAASAWRTAPFDPRAHRPDVPGPLAELVVRATDPDPARRFASAAEVSAALAVPAPARPVPRRVAAAAPGATATMHAAEAQIATALLQPADALPPAAAPRRGVVVILAAAALMVAGLVALAERADRSSNVTTPTATTSPAVTVATTTALPAAAPPTAPAPAPATVAPADEGGGNGNGNGRGKDKDKGRDG